MDDLLIADCSGLIVGIMMGVWWMLLPGAGLARLFERFGVDCGRGWDRMAWSLLLAVAILPAIDALVVRGGGMAAMAGLHAMLALLALPKARSLFLAQNARWPIAAPLILFWAIIVAFAFVDFNMAGSLNQSLLDLDLVKHAAVTGAIAREGLPFTDPFFARPGYVGYYYYFYLWPAAIQWAGGAWVNARMAFAAGVFWAGLAFVALLWRVAVDAGLVRPDRERRFVGMILLSCFLGGTDLIFMVLRYSVVGNVEAQADWWNTEVVFALRSALWVPHHLTALIAVWVGWLLLVRAQAAQGRNRWILAFAAGLAIVTCFGSSVWIMLTAMPVLIGWGCISLWRRDPTLAVAGICALLVASFQLADLLTYRHDSGMPIALTVRRFTVLIPDDPGWGWLHAVLLPLNYAMEFGIFMWGAVMWWRMGAFDRREPVQWLLVASTGASLLVGSFVKSTIINNDLAWRSIWFAQCAVMLWTIAWLQGPGVSLRRQRPSFYLLLALGLMTVTWDLVGLRLIRPPWFRTSFTELISLRADDDDQRRIYEQAARMLPVDDVIQHNPALHRRIFNFGLYGIQKTAVADQEANLFGASPNAVNRRIAILRPIYERPLSRQEIVARARAVGVDHLIFASVDPVWQQASGPPPGLHCRFRQPLACLVSVKDIAS
ncbi:hypothetical protein [Sphingobium sp.]|uniref:hypothetical protein n=1 Tax=Sphingobium sp. TaxID=1912891 RepID=UPI003B3ABDBC